MGDGYYSPTTKTFNLFVWFRYDASADLGRWQSWFTWASEMLAMATDGRFSLGSVVYQLGGSSDTLGADVRIPTGDPAETRDRLGFGVDGSYMTVGDGNLGQPGRLVHELGHYAFDLWDEYRGPSGNTTCVPDNEDTFACVMQRSANSIQLPVNAAPRWHPQNIVTEFCSDDNVAFPHRTSDPKTFQHAMNGEGCWQTIANLKTRGKADYGTFMAPPAAPDTSDVNVAAIPTPVPVPMIRALGTRRFVLLLDRSGSMQSNNAIAGVRYAAHFWIDLESMLGNQLAVVSYAASPSPTVGLGTVPLPPAAGYGQAHNNVDTALQNPNGLTNIREAINFGDTTLSGLVAGDTMLLFSDGQHNVGPDPAPAAGTKIHTVTFGSSAGRAQMEAIANATNGIHRHVPNPAAADHTELEINKALSEIAAISHSDRIAAADASLLPSPRDPEAPEPGSPEDLETIAAMTSEEVEERGDMFELEVFVEEGVHQVTFAANHRSIDNMFLYVLDPDDSTFPGGTPLEPVIGQFSAGDAHATYTVSPSTFGTWRMRIRRIDVTDQKSVPVRLFAFADHADLTVAVFGPERLYTTNDRVLVRAVAHYPTTLTGVKIRIWPEEDETQEQQLDELFPGIGQYEIDLGTFGAPGSYPYVIEFRGDDNTIPVADDADDDADENDPPRPTGPWVRRVEHQIHVGPLPTGEDNDGVGDGDGHGHGDGDGDGPGTGCCGALIRLLERACRLGETTLGRLGRVRSTLMGRLRRE